MQPGDSPGLSRRQAARITREAGLRAEAAANRGAWRFAETAAEDVPHD
ncbi:hypothetical protein AB0Q95_44430 [Streptomyces sp. NPDC059900]